MTGSLDFTDKTVLITGAFGLFGWRLSKCFLRSGANVVVCGHNLAQIQSKEEELLKDFDVASFLVLPLEITDRGSIDKVLKSATKKFRKIDVLINNAAKDASVARDNDEVRFAHGFENYPVELLRESLEINTLGTIQMTQAACSIMVKQGFGNIINVGSIYSMLAPNPKLYGDIDKAYKPIDYVASKSFIPNFTRYIAAYYSKQNIRCNAIAPHGVFNEQNEFFLKNFNDLSPMGRMCTKEEIEGPFLFLASNSSSYMNGTTLVVDGGWSIW